MRFTKLLLGSAMAVICANACGGGGGGATAPAMPSPAPSAASVARISADMLTDPLGQHATEVEPSAIAVGPTVVAAYQVGRQFVAGASAIGVATSSDGGATWTSKLLPLLTASTGGAESAASDPVVVYDSAHATWLVASMPIVNQNVAYPQVSTSRDGVVWNAPVAVSTGDVSDDKEWIACDTAPASPHYGHCYVAWDDAGRNGLLLISTSTDGGRTWGPPKRTPDSVMAIGAQPLIAPNGNVIVVSDDFNETSVFATVSSDGGVTWSASIRIAPIVNHFEDGLRSGALVSTAIDAAGTVYATWQDCRFEPSCNANDLVLTSSSNGTAWSPIVRIPLDPIASNTDHFIPGLSVAPATAGSNARLGLSYYLYPVALCGSVCALLTGYAESRDGGSTWSSTRSPFAAMALNSIAQTNQGRMVADYIATVFSMRGPVSIVAASTPPLGTTFEEATFAWNPRPSSMALAARSSRVYVRTRPGNHRAIRGPLETL